MANKGTIQILEANTYEVPTNNSACSRAMTQPARTEPEYDHTESTYAVPNVYEYATLGPNEQMVTVNFSAVVTHSSPSWLLIINLQLFI